MGAKQQAVYKIEIEDRPGALSELLASTADAGANVVFMAALSTSGGKGAVYLTADKPDVLKEIAQSGGLSAKEYAGFLLSGADRIGAGAEVTKPLAAEGINIVLSAAMVAGGEYQLIILVDPEYAEAASKILGS